MDRWFSLKTTIELKNLKLDAGNENPNAESNPNALTFTHYYGYNGRTLYDFDQVIKRVFYNDLIMKSPYNTYVNVGLPPGPIAMPDITALEAVLNPEKNDYIYFCASVERFGYHEFAATLAEHNVNAKKYSDWIASQGVTR